MSDVKEDSHPSEEDNEARPSVGEERQRNPGQRSDPHHGRDVDRRLPADEHGEAGCEALSEWILAAHGDIEACVREQAVGGDHRGDANQA